MACQVIIRYQSCMQLNVPRELLKYRIEGIINLTESYQLRRVKDQESGDYFSMKLFRKDFYHEAVEKQIEEKIKAFQHQNILKVYELFEDYRFIFVIEELSYSKDIFDVLADKQFNEEESADIVKQIFQALLYLQKNNFVHNELRPQNVLLEQENGKFTIKLINLMTFSKSKNSISKLAFNNSVYDPPELLQNKQMSIAGNVWQVGLILFCMICSQMPYTLQQLISGSYKNKKIYDHPNFNSTSKECIDFIKLLLKSQPQERSTPQRLLKQPWIYISKKSMQIKTQKRMRSKKLAFMASKSKQALITYLNRAIELNNEIEKMMKIFERIDQTQSGKLSKSEIMKGFLEYNPKESNLYIVDKVLKNFDGSLVTYDFKEFSKHFFKKQRQILSDNLEVLYSYLDYESKGEVCRQQVIEILQDIAVGIGDQWQKSICNSEQKYINFKEFSTSIQTFIDSFKERK